VAKPPMGSGESSGAALQKARAGAGLAFAFVFLLRVSGLASPLWAQAAPPNEFNGVGAWTPRQAWIANPAERPSLVAEAEAAHFSVAEPNRGMKWSADVKFFGPADSGFLVVRYRAENLGDADYFLWAIDGSKEGRCLVPRRAVRDDGQWHVLAVDLWAAGVTGRIRGLAIAVGASSKVPASLWLGPIRHVPEAPSGAERCLDPETNTIGGYPVGLIFAAAPGPGDWQKFEGCCEVPAAVRYYALWPKLKANNDYGMGRNRLIGNSNGPSGG